MKLKSWPAFWLKVKLLLVEMLCGYYLALFFFFFHFPFQRLSLSPRNCIRGSLAELWGSHLILFSWNRLEKSAQMDWDKLVTWIMRGGGRYLGDFHPGVNKLGKFEKGQLHWASLNLPYRISIQYFFSMSYCL